MVWVTAWCRLMQYRNSLRFRIFFTFVGAGLLLGPLLVLAFLTIANELEEFAIERALVGQLQKVMTKSEQVTPPEDPNLPNLRIFGDIPHDDISPDLHGKNGIYEVSPGNRPAYEKALPPARLIDPGQATWILAVGSQGATTYVVASDQTTMETRESLTSWVVAAGTLLSVSASLWVGYLFTKRLIKPLHQLAAATSTNDDQETSEINPEDYPPDEIGQLATALKHDRERRTEALLREKAFSAEVAHELRNPLAVMQSTMEIIERDSALQPSSGRALERALEAAQEMNETLSALLLLGRSQPSLARYAAVDLATVLRSIVDKNSAQSTTAIALEEIDTPRLQAPEAAIRMIADNLVRNALQNTPAGQVKVSLMTDRMVVQDTGIGIPASEIEAVRRNGIRGSNASGSGSGLGLALVDRLCQTFDWRFEIQSQINEGTTATWYFT